MNNLGWIGVAALSLGMALAYALGDLWLGAIMCLALGAVWLLAISLRRPRFGDSGMVGFVALAVVGVWYALPSFWMLLGALGALLCWDQCRFEARLRGTQRVDAAPTLVRDHTRHIVIVAALGLLLGGLALGVELRLPFVLTLALGVLIAAALGWALRQARTP